jgi:hypothetical protein
MVPRGKRGTGVSRARVRRGSTWRGRGGSDHTGRLFFQLAIRRSGAVGRRNRRSPLGRCSRRGEAAPLLADSPLDGRRQRACASSVPQPRVLANGPTPRMARASGRARFDRLLSPALVAYLHELGGEFGGPARFFRQAFKDSAGRLERAAEKQSGSRLRRRCGRSGRRPPFSHRVCLLGVEQQPVTVKDDGLEGRLHRVSRFGLSPSQRGVRGLVGQRLDLRTEPASRRSNFQPSRPPSVLCRGTAGCAVEPIGGHPVGAAHLSPSVRQDAFAGLDNPDPPLRPERDTVPMPLGGSARVAEECSVRR